MKTDDWVNYKTEIRASPLGGKGLFATSPIAREEKVLIWRGNCVDKTGAEKAKTKGKLVMQWDENLFSVEDRGDSRGYFVNHSCEPNLWMKDAYTLIAMRDIGVGEELTADYAMWEADENYVSKWECECGNKNCRHKITGRDWRIRKLQEKYEGHFSPLINKRINSL